MQRRITAGSSLPDTTTTGTPGYCARRYIRPGKAAHSRHRQIEQDQVDIAAGIEQLRHLVEGSGFREFDTRKHAAHGLAQGPAKQRMVVGDDQPVERGVGHSRVDPLAYPRIGGPAPCDEFTTFSPESRDLPQAWSMPAAGELQHDLPAVRPCPVLDQIDRPARCRAAVVRPARGSAAKRRSAWSAHERACRPGPRCRGSSRNPAVPDGAAPKRGRAARRDRHFPELSERPRCGAGTAAAMPSCAPAFAGELPQYRAVISRKPSPGVSTVSSAVAMTVRGDGGDGGQAQISFPRFDGRSGCVVLNRGHLALPALDHIDQPLPQPFHHGHGAVDFGIARYFHAGPASRPRGGRLRG